MLHLFVFTISCCCFVASQIFSLLGHFFEGNPASEAQGVREMHGLNGLIKLQPNLGGGFKYFFLFSTLLGEDDPF